MLLWFLVALALFAIGTLLWRSADRREARHPVPDRPPPPPTVLQPAWPERRIDLDELEPRDVVEIETVAGGRYRFRRQPERDYFAVESLREGSWREVFRAFVIASFRQQAVFPRTFALGCSLHIVVEQETGPAPKRIQMLTAVQHLRERDNPQIN